MRQANTDLTAFVAHLPECEYFTILAGTIYASHSQGAPSISANTDEQTTSANGRAVLLPEI